MKELRHGSRKVNKEVKRGNTAIKRSSHSVPYKAHLKAGRLEGKKVLDYGCGRGFDVIECQKKGLDVQGFDRFQEGWDSLPVGEFDVVTCNYVLNVIEDPVERKAVLEEIKSLGRVAYITVRSDLKSIKSSWEPMNDGYYTSGKTCQKIYTVDSLKAEFGDVEIIANNNTGIMFKIGA